MKLLSYILVLTLPLMCSSLNDENYKFAHDDSEVVYNESPILSSKIYSPEQSTDQKIIKTSYLKFETKNLDKTFLQIKKAIQNNKGFIQDDNSNKSYNTITRHLIIRIPKNNFQNTLNAVSKDVPYFDTKRISAKDVTEEFIDLEARLKAKLTLEKRYLELLSKAKNVKEMLEIEAKQGRLKYLKNKVSLSTIDIEFYKLTSEAPVATSYGTKMWNAIKSGFNGISIFFLGLLHIWPFILILIIVGFLIRKWIKKSKK